MRTEAEIKEMLEFMEKEQIRTKHAEGYVAGLKFALGLQ